MEQINTLILDGWEMVDTNLDGATVIAKEIQQLSAKSSYQSGIAHGNLLLARCLAGHNHIPDAVELTEKANQEFLKQQDMDGLVRVYRVMSYLHMQRSEWEECYKAYHRGLSLIKEKHLVVWEGKYPIEVFLHNNAGTACAISGKMKEALTYFKAALKLAEIHSGPMMVAILSNIAEVYLCIDDIQAAIQYNHRALQEIKKHGGEYYCLYQVYQNFGQIHAKLKEYDQALEKYRYALEFTGKDHLENARIAIFISLSELYIQQNKDEKALKYLTEAKCSAEKLSLHEHLRKIYLLYAQLYERSGEFKKALKYQKKYIEADKQTAAKSVDRIIQITEAEKQIENAKRDSELFQSINKELKQKSKELEVKAVELEQSYKNITFISEIGQRITASLDLEMVLTTIYKSINELMDATVFGIGIVDGKTDSIHYKIYMENAKRLPSNKGSLAEVNFASECIRSRKIIIRNDLKGDEGYDAPVQDKAPSPVRSLIYYPLMMEDTIIGTITVQSYKADAYTTRHIEMLKALASYMAIAIVNSQKSEEQRQMMKELRVTSILDPLTELFNRRYMINRIKEECEKFLRNARKFSIIIADLDHFKHLNDTYGHDFGDHVLKTVAAFMRSHLRRPVYVARWGGEEFLILLPETNGQQAASAAERLRQSLENETFSLDKVTVSVTMTLGIAEYDGTFDMDAVIKKADDALYEGKRKGKNCVVLFTK